MTGPGPVLTTRTVKVTGPPGSLTTVRLAVFSTVMVGGPALTTILEDTPARGTTTEPPGGSVVVAVALATAKVSPSSGRWTTSNVDSMTQVEVAIRGDRGRWGGR